MAGFLTDGEILKALNAGLLMSSGTWAKENIRHASYTLRLGHEVRVVNPVSPSSDVARDERIVRVDQNHPLILSPGQTALLYCEEELALPSNVLGFTVARGLLYGEALVPENTYVDPGFTGSLYTTVVNVSSRKITLTYKMGIARIFFCELSRHVQEKYRSGKALGIEQQLSSVSAVPVTTIEQARLASDGELRQTLSGIGPVGVMSAEYSTRTSARLVGVTVFALLWPVLLLAGVKLGASNPWVAFALGIVGNLVAAAIAAVAPRLFRRWQQ